MRFLVDECTGPKVAAWLREAGHEVFSVFDEARGLTDDEILAQACAEDRILITNDKDFGEKVFREKQEHRGVIFLRLENERAANKIEVLRPLLESYAAKLPEQFVVATETQVRFAGKL
jgi:predicted nuclease of predicted toxin-antitoxin system